MELSNKSYLVSMNYPLQLSLTQGERLAISQDFTQLFQGWFFRYNVSLRID